MIDNNYKFTPEALKAIDDLVDSGSKANDAVDEALSRIGARAIKQREELIAQVKDDPENTKYQVDHFGLVRTFSREYFLAGLEEGLQMMRLLYQPVMKGDYVVDEGCSGDSPCLGEYKIVDTTEGK